MRDDGCYKLGCGCWGGERLTEPQSCGENKPGNTDCSLVAGILNLSFILHITRTISAPTLESTCFIKREA